MFEKPIFNNTGMAVGTQIGNSVFSNNVMRVGSVFGNNVLLDRQPGRDIKLFGNHLDCISGSRFEPFKDSRLW